MARRHYLIVTRDVAARASIAARVAAGGGRVLVLLPRPALVVEMGYATKDEIVSRPDVVHLGAVEIAPRPIRRIRVSPDGARLNG